MKKKKIIGIFLFLVLFLGGILSYNYFTKYNETDRNELLNSLRDKTLDGEFNIISYSLKFKDAATKSLPTFVFSKGHTVKIKPDFFVPFFKDSVFKYHLDLLSGTLTLKGENTKHKIKCEPKGQRYVLYINDSQFYTIDIIK